MMTETCCEADQLDPASDVRAPLIYIAAPYTRPDPVQNTYRAIQIADALLDAGFVALVPHLNLLWHLISPKRYSQWLAHDGQLLIRCDAVLRVPGLSDGAVLECAFAEIYGIDVIRPGSDSPATCATAVTHWFAAQGSHLRSNAVDCHECECAPQICDDCQRCHVCCRCGAGEG